MRTFAPVIIIFLIAVAMWAESSFWTFSREEYVSQKVLELSYPVDVKIDIDLLTELSTAYEQ